MVTAQIKTTRHGDTPLISTPHSRRSHVLYPVQWADLIDKSDTVRMLIDPQGKYVQNGKNAMGRKMDDIIIDAMNGDSYEGETGQTTVNFPATQQITEAGTDGLTKAKLIATKKKFRANDVDPSIQLYLSYGAEQLEDVLGDTTLTSADYNTVRLLMAGDIDTFMGFKWIPSERLDKVGNMRHVMAWAEDGMGLMIGEDIEVDIGKRRDKSNSMQVYVEMDVGAVRIEDAKVVRIECYE